jgi:glycerol-3-phosphate acyltransferase PlsY
MWVSLLVGLLTSYLLGNLNGAVCMSALAHDDVRSHGSGNAGLTNFVRNFGVSRGIFVILIDGCKAVLSCVLTGLLLAPYGMYLEGAALGGFAVMVGHNFPALLGFRGGKGILSALFIAISVDWRIAVLGFGIFLTVYLLSQYVSLGSIVGAAAFAAGFVLFHHDNLTVMLSGVAMAVMAILMHRGNIARLIKGQERKTILFGKGKKK